jgi:hypothetical protein
MTDAKIYAVIAEAGRDALLDIIEFQGDSWKYQRLDTEPLRDHIRRAYERGELLAFEILDATGYAS